MNKKIEKFIQKNIAYYLSVLIKNLENLDRVKIVFFLFIIFAFVIIFYSFKYSVLEYDYYKTLADKQQTIEVKNSVNRGTIYSNNDPIWVLATSTELSDLAIDPQEIWNKEKLVTFLTDIVFDELCFWKQSEECVNKIQLFLKKDPSSEESDYNQDNMKEEIKIWIQKKIEKKYIDLVLIKENLTQEEMDKVNNLWLVWIYFVINNLYADPTKITDENYVAKKLNEVLQIQEYEIKNKLLKRISRYIKILNKLSLHTKDEINARIENEKNAIKKWVLTEENSIYKLIILDPHPTRFYPEKNLASQIIGFVDNNKEWKYWIEWYFNEDLKWQEWIKITKKDISWRAIWLYELPEQKIINWSDIKLTIDRNIQKEISKILEKWVKEFKANKGSVIVMDPNSWEVVAMVNYPDFDPNEFWNVYEIEKVSYWKYPNPWFDLLWMPVFVEDSLNWFDIYIQGKKKKFRLATEQELWNRAIPKFKYKNNFWPWIYKNDVIWSLYEPGSVFKAVTVAVWIDTWDIRPSDMYKDKGFVEIDQFKISNVSKECNWYHTYSHALDWSCNVWMIDIVKKIWSSLFYKYLLDFWFAWKTNITLEWEVFGKIPPYEKWSKAKLFTMAFWQWITVNLLQMATAYSVIANGWIYMKPYIVDTITLPNWQVIKNSPTPIRRVIKEETSKTLIAMLTEWAQIWFAKKWSVLWYQVAGKTWTSQIAYKWWYEEGWPWHTVTSYWGFAPSSNPKFVMIVRIDRPRTAVYAETTSSALFSEIAKFLLNYYRIPKSS